MIKVRFSERGIKKCERVVLFETILYYRAESGKACLRQGRQDVVPRPWELFLRILYQRAESGEAWLRQGRQGVVPSPWELFLRILVQEGRVCTRGPSLARPGSGKAGRALCPAPGSFSLRF